MRLPYIIQFGGENEQEEITEMMKKIEEGWTVIQVDLFDVSDMKGLAVILEK